MIGRLLFVLPILLGLAQGAWGEDRTGSGKTTLPEASGLPVRVHVALRVLNILEVKEVSGQGRLHLELTQRWQDPRLAFDAVPRGLAREDRVGDEADDHLKTCLLYTSRCV